MIALRKEVYFLLLFLLLGVVAAVIVYFRAPVLDLADEIGLYKIERKEKIRQEVKIAKEKLKAVEDFCANYENLENLNESGALKKEDDFAVFRVIKNYAVCRVIQKADIGQCGILKNVSSRGIDPQSADYYSVSSASCFNEAMPEFLVLKNCSPEAVNACAAVSVGGKKECDFFCGAFLGKKESFCEPAKLNLGFYRLCLAWAKNDADQCAALPEEKNRSNCFDSYYSLAALKEKSAALVAKIQDEILAFNILSGFDESADCGMKYGGEIRNICRKRTEAAEDELFLLKQKLEYDR